MMIIIPYIGTFIVGILSGIVADRCYSFFHRGYDKSKALKEAPELYTLVVSANNCYDPVQDAVAYKITKGVDVDRDGNRQMICDFQKINTDKPKNLSENPRIIRIRIHNNTNSGIHIKSFSYKDYDDYNTFNWDGKTISVDERLTLFLEIGDCPNAINIAHNGYDFTYPASLTNCFSRPSQSRKIKSKE